MAKAPAKAAPAKGAAKKPMSKSAFVAHLAEAAEIDKSKVLKILEAIEEAVKSQLSGKGPGKMVLPGLARISLTKVKAQKGGLEKINPLTKQPYITKDKPAYNKVVIRPAKSLKEALK